MDDDTLLLLCGAGNGNYREGDAGVLPTTSSCSAPLERGKSMLARRLTTILPAMTLAEAIETTCIHSVAGLSRDRTALVTNRPDRGSLCSSIAMRTGNGSYDFAIREGYDNNCVYVVVENGISMADLRGIHEFLSIDLDHPTRTSAGLTSLSSPSYNQPLPTLLTCWAYGGVFSWRHASGGR